MKVFFFVLLSIISVDAKAEKESAKPEMHIFAQEITLLQKYMLTDATFNAPANESAIQKSLNTLSTHLVGLKKKSFTNDSSLQVNLQMLNTHIADASAAFKQGNKAYARFMLQSSTQMCIACHTRLKAADFVFPEQNLEGMTPLEKADFFFATRQFDKAKDVFESIVSSYPKSAGAYDVRKALLSLALYYARVKESPEAGADYFTKISLKDDLPQYMQKEVAAWAKDFKLWAAEKKKIDPKKMTESQLLAEAKKLLKRDDFGIMNETDRNFHIRRLRASSILHSLLEAPGAQSPAKGEALFYLGQIYHRLAMNVFFQFGEMYLKACINEYKKTNIARDCYDALERSTVEGFTGSSGTNIPDSEQVELFKLKRLAY